MLLIILIWHFYEKPDRLWCQLVQFYTQLNFVFRKVAKHILKESDLACEYN